ncbi:ECF-type riboflavin transporter, S component [Romboutsia lituseburensis]|uniref:ECF-type riboflavin transporter, S component n=1 Tax=Romboutsia lituseburensis DSM 797 TaxID=1121325 RepID=A0A1G9LD31_9FIRM|nr:ECF transporter S component [Romboutsia lituseburensis]CEH35259.1 ECF-type riboflavin transporter, S component [Romboutsia lituseburensis]SDL59657.1 ECF-type riboflavin transporter, S component [Romboutsia lituseburensis DSM 797]
MEVTSKSNQKNTTRDLVETALLIALVFIATRFINIRLPIASSGGLVHLGNTMLFIAAIVFGKKKVLLQVLLVWLYLIYYQNGQYGHRLHLL